MFFCVLKVSNVLGIQNALGLWISISPQAEEPCSQSALVLEFQVASQEALFSNMLCFGGCFVETGVRRKPCVVDHVTRIRNVSTFVI